MFRKSILKHALLIGVFQVLLFENVFSDVFNQYNMQPDVWHMITPVSGQVDNKGDLNISIPIVTIPGRNGLNFNVNFSYHAPIRVKQRASWIGLGWNFDPGSITRDVQGGIDGEPGVDFTDTVGVQPDMYYLTIPGHGSIPMSKSNRPEFYTYLGNQDYLPLNSNYFYTHEWRPWKIETDTSSSLDIFNPQPKNKNAQIVADYSKFTVTTEDGIRYIFAMPTMARYRSYAAYTHQELYASAWRLVAILGTDYPYDTEPNVNDPGSWVKIEYRWDNVDDVKTCYVSEDKLVQNTYPWKIITPTHYAEFITSPIMDVDMYYEISNQYLYRRLDTIKVSTRFGDDIPFKTVVLNHDQQLCNFDSLGKGKTTLKSIDYYSNDENKEPGYYFKYTNLNPDLDSQFFLTSNFCDDDFGYYDNGNYSNYFDDNTNDAKAWSLDTVYFPTGGKEVYTYENDVIFDGFVNQEDLYLEFKYYDDHDYQPRLVDTSYAFKNGSDPRFHQGGTRVTQIKRYDGMGNIYIDTFTYGIGFPTGTPSGFFTRKWEWGYFTPADRGHVAVVYNMVQKFSSDGTFDIKYYSVPYWEPESEILPFTLDIESLEQINTVYVYQYNLGSTVIHGNCDLKFGKLYKNEIYGTGSSINNEYEFDELTYTEHSEAYETPIAGHIVDINWLLMLNTRTITEDNSLIDTTEYVYDTDPRLKSKVIQRGSLEDEKITEYYYAYNEYTDLENSNMLAQLGKTDFGYKDENGTTKYYSSKVTTWREFEVEEEDIWQPYRDYSWKVDTPQSSKPSFNAWSYTSTPNSDWIRDSKYFYDDYGNKITIHDASDQITYLYYGDNDNNFSNSASAGDLNHGYLTGAKRGSLDQAYDYYENTGLIQSITDPEGNVTTYKHNEFNRLMQVIDAKDNILSENLYYFNRVPEDTSFNQNDPNYIQSVAYPNFSMNGLVGYWKLEGDAEDYSGTGNHGAISGNKEFIHGFSGEVIEFDQSDANYDYVTVSRHSSIETLSGLTIAAWVYPASNVADGDIIVNKENEYEIGWKTGGQLKTAIRTDQSSWFWTGGTGSNTVPINKWTFVVATWDGSYIREYVNGELKRSSQQNGNTTYSGNIDLRIGRRSSASPTSHWEGKIDEVKLYDTALTGDEIKDLYNSTLTTQYIDGLARTVQSQSPLGSDDITVAYEFDRKNRLIRSWKPYLISKGHIYESAYDSTSAYEHSVKNYYDGIGGRPNCGLYPYSETYYGYSENDVLMNLFPGELYHFPQSDESYQYGHAIESTKRFQQYEKSVNSSTVGDYPADRLRMLTTIDEDKNYFITYNDIFGNTIRNITHERGLGEIRSWAQAFADLQTPTKKDTIIFFPFVSESLTVEWRNFLGTGSGHGIIEADTILGGHSLIYDTHYDGTDEDFDIWVDEGKTYYFIVTARYYQFKGEENTKDIRYFTSSIEFWSTYYQLTEYEVLTTTEFEYDGASNLIEARSPNYFDPPTGSSASDWITEYTYNTLNQLTQKVTVDAGTTKYKYDSLGNLRFVQDANLDSQGDDIIFYQYDSFNRNVVEGVATSDATIPSWTNLDPDNVYDGSSGENFENLSLHPGNLKVRYYYDGTNSYSGADNLLGKLTSVRYDSYSDTSNTYYSYDEVGNIEWIVQKVKGLEKKISYEYDALGKIKRITYDDDGADQFYIWYEYDQAGRLYEVFSSLFDEKPQYTDAIYEYWPTGQVKSLKLGESSSSFADTLFYTYHPRDWLISINAQDGVSDISASSPPFNFAMHLKYDDWEDAPQFAGNIAAAEYFTYRDQTSHSNSATGSFYHRYDFEYDDLHRLTTANFKYASTSPFTWLNTTSAYNVTGFSYDPNGNIHGLTRKNESGSGSTLTYNYNSGTNKLNYVQGLTGHSSGNYLYDYNGNLVEDNSKHIASAIIYDYRNLPNDIRFEAEAEDNRLKYSYDHTGQRVYKYYNEDGNTSAQYYIRGVDGKTLAVYDEDKKLMFINIYGLDLIGKAQ